MKRDDLIRRLSALLRPIYGGIGCVLCLHRVLPEDQLSTLPENRALELAADDLRAILDWAFQRGLEPISLDALPDRLKTPKPRKFIAFTFDDGYRDNLTVALPIFREYRAPFAVGLTTGFLDRTEPVWWYAVERALLSAGAVRFEADGVTCELTWSPNPGARDDMLKMLGGRIRALDMKKRNQFVAGFCASAGVDPMRVTDELILTWDEAQELARDPLVTISAHSTGHYDLRLLAEDEARAQLADSKKAIETKLGRPVRRLAFPFGGRLAVGPREFRLAEECGYETAFTTRVGNLFPQHARHLCALPRLGVSGNYPAVVRLEKLESGLVPAVSNRFRRVVTE